MQPAPLSASAAQALARELRSGISGEVRFDAGSRALYATDASNYRQVPIGVVVPRDARDAACAIEIAHRHGAPVLPRGGGTSLAGQCCNVAVVLDMSKYMNRVLEVDPRRRLARVEPGCVLDDLRTAAAPYGLTFGPDPSTHNRCTLGGMIGNNSCGVHSIRGRRTVDNVERLDVVTAEGLRLALGAVSAGELERRAAAAGRSGEIHRGLREIIARYGDEIRARYPDIPRRVSGYSLPQLLPEHGHHIARALVGSEGTCVTVLEATVRLIDDPPHHALALIGFRDIYAAADSVPRVLESGCIGLEGIDDYLVRNMRRRHMLAAERSLLPEGDGWLLVEFGGETAAQARERARRLCEDLRGNGATDGCVYADRSDQEAVWRVREAGLGATAREQGENITWEGWEDSAVAPAQLGAYLRDFRKLLDRYDYRGALYGHFGDGCLHTRINFDLKTQPGIAKWRRFLGEAADLVVRHGGSLSGEHGDGQARALLLPKMFGERLVEAFRDFKRVWDPAGRMNPGKLVDPYAPTVNLRLGADYDPPREPTHFAFRDDGGSFAAAALRCVGVGACRKHDSGTMCPSYMATREERHSTRGRARLLFEMLQGDPVTQGWRSDAVADALELCLSCKACRSECPVQVDMATYKAEFLAHHHEGRLRPVSHYLLGYIGRWAPLAARMPGLANRLVTMPVLGALGRHIAGIASERELPRFAAATYRAARRARTPGRHGGRRVVLWTDTFNNHFQPEVLHAAERVLAACGHEVELAPGGLCCGRPCYDFGLLDEARRRLRRVVTAMRPWLREGVPIVVAEPSCLSVFRDELLNLFPHDEDGSRLAQQAQSFDEFIDGRENVPAPARRRTGLALVQGHCHQQSLSGMGATRRMLGAAGLAADVLDAGCCGLAGSFGYRHHAVSAAIGARVLFPALERQPGALVVADGFSCREQIRQFTGRRALHLAQVLDPAHGEPAGVID